jgi:hypothetical protein
MEESGNRKSGKNRILTKTNTEKPTIFFDRPKFRNREVVKRWETFTY